MDRSTACSRSPDALRYAYASESVGASRSRASIYDRERTSSAAISGRAEDFNSVPVGGQETHPDTDPAIYHRDRIGDVLLIEYQMSPFALRRE
jgi:hypothetical protein